MPRKRPPTDPAKVKAKLDEQRRKLFASVDLQPEAATLQQNESVLVEQLTRPDPAAKVKGNEKRAQRQDVFARLFARSALSTPQLDAVRRLERDMAERRGEADRGLSGLGTRVDCAKPIPVSDRSLAAADRIDGEARADGRIGVFRLMDPKHIDLLSELIEPRRILVGSVVETQEDGTQLRLDMTDRWRAVVRLITRTKDRDAQADRVREAAEALAGAYREIDNAPRRRAA